MRFPMTAIDFSWRFVILSDVGRWLSTVFRGNEGDNKSVYNWIYTRFIFCG